MPRRKDKLRFVGTYQQLQAIVSMTAFPGVWELMPAGYRRFRCHCGAILNWWLTTGTVNFQGSKAAKAAFERAIIDVIKRSSCPMPMLPEGRSG